MKTNLHKADFPLVPISQFSPTPKDQIIPLIESAPIADWSTLHITAQPILNSTALGQDALSAVGIIVWFTESRITSFGQTVYAVGGRTLSVGAIDTGLVIQPSVLDVRLPVRGSYVTIALYYPSNQTNVTGLLIGAWLSADPDYVAPVLQPIGYAYSTIPSGDSLFGGRNASTGISVAAGAAKIVELAQQTIGKMTIKCQSTKGGAAIAAGEVIATVVNKAVNNTNGITTDQNIWFLGNTSDVADKGIPLTGFRQGLLLINNSSPAGTTLTTVSAWPEYN